MFRFDSLAKTLKMNTWKVAEPELHTEVILAVETRETGTVSSTRGFELFRGWYSTWITGPVTEGCGKNQQLILDKEPGASLHWKTEMVVLVDAKCWISGSIKPGVVPQAIFECGWWAKHDALVYDTATGLMVPLHEHVGLLPGVCKTRIRHNDVFYPPKHQQHNSASR